VLIAVVIIYSLVRRVTDGQVIGRRRPLSATAICSEFRLTSSVFPQAARCPSLSCASLKAVSRQREYDGAARSRHEIVQKRDSA
jgi:hypothetical protein